VADIAERLTPAVVNISTSQVERASEGVPMPDLPEGSPFREFFEEFFNRQDRDPHAAAPAAGELAGLRLRHRPATASSSPTTTSSSRPTRSR
jgi:S1-C subfamily serine protease